ncbi:MAG: preprotein translocase subunit SecF [Clostridium sp.]|jgi:preprotein translocase subunit SecF
MERKKKKKKIWLFILIPILVLAVSAGGAYAYLQTKLKLGGDSAKTEVVNALIKEVVTNPSKIKKVMDSITITDGDASTTSGGKETSVNMAANRSENASTGISASGTNQSASVVPVKNETSSEIPSSTSSLEYMKAHLTEYDLLSTSAKNLGGNTYQLTATVKHKTTGEVKTVEVTKQLSESMKEMLRKYR